MVDAYSSGYASGYGGGHAVSTALSYILEVGGADVIADVLALSWTRGMDSLQVMSPPRAGQANVELDNHHGAYNPSVSPIAAGQPVALVVEHDAIQYPVFAGELDHPEHHGRDFDERLGLTAYDPLVRLADTRGLSTALYRDIRTDEVLGHICDAAGVPAAARVFDVGATKLAWWHLDNEDAFGAMVRDVLNSEGPTAQIYVDGSGRLVFRSRHAIGLDARSINVQATYANGEMPIIDPWQYEDGLRDRANTCAVEVVRRVVGDVAVAWTLGETLVIPAGESRTIDARAGSGALIFDAIQPSLAGGDYTLAGGSVVVALARTSGATVPITLTAGASTAVVNDLRLRAKTVTIEARSTLRNTNHPLAVGEAAIPYPLSVSPDLPSGVAQDFCNAIVEHYRLGRPQMRFGTLNMDNTSLVSLLEREIGDRVAVENPRLGVAEEVFILQRTDTLRIGRAPGGTNGRLQYVTFGTGQAVDLDLFILDTSELDVDELSF
jgi:hypothetical protein